jgi:hypothetical protein
MTITNLGRLITSFAPPSDCSLLDISFDRTSRLNGNLGKACTARGDVLVFHVAELCYPGNFGSYINSNSGFPSTIAVYSPGTI